MNSIFHVKLLFLIFVMLSTISCNQPTMDEWEFERGTDGFISKSSLKNLKRMAESGDPEAQVELADAYAIGNIQGGHDGEKAVYWAEKAASQDYVYGLLFLYNLYSGEVYIHKSIPVDPLLSVSYRRKAAQLGDAGSQLELANYYFRGQIVEKDFDEGLKWLKLASRNNEPTAQYMLAGLYSEGVGVEKSQSAAKHLYRQVYESKNSMYTTDAGHKLAQVYHLNGSDWTATKLYFELAQLGSSRAHINLGVLYENGITVPKNDILAYMWTSIGLSKSTQNSDAKTRMENLEQSMPPHSIVVSQEKAAACASSKYVNCSYPDSFMNK